MLTLVRKDIAVVAAFGWLIVWLVAPSYLVPAIAAARTGEVFLWVNVAFAAAAIVSVCLLDARSGADRFIHSLPVTRADVVRARYVTAIVTGDHRARHRRGGRRDPSPRGRVVRRGRGPGGSHRTSG
ncbi:MAG: ABC-2 transporter permease [Ignavibacteriales bacterium]|nr:ABC-2 transporter permease [Ignavibacteriales bacterium]